MSKIQTIDPNWVNITSKAEVITPSTASEWLSRNIENRPLSKNQVQYYARQMREGKWRVNGEAICFDKEGCLINGQHRLQAIIESSVPIASVVTRGVEHEAFATYDSGMNRKLSDIFALKHILNATTVSSIINKYVSLKYSTQAIATTSGGIGLNNLKISATQRRTKEEILDEYFTNPEFFQEISRFAQSCNGRLKVLPVSIIGAYMSYLIVDKKHEMDKVCEFFTTLSTLGANSNPTILALQSKLLNNGLNTKANMKMSATYIQQIIIKTWNAYIKGREIKTLKWNESVEGKLQFE